MKRKYLLFIIIVIFSFCIKVSARTGYFDATDYANNYIKNFSGYNRYIITQQVNYGYTAGVITSDSSFTNGGLLNKDEFVYSKNNNGETYLNNGLDYFTMTKIDSGSVYAIKPDEADYLVRKTMSDTSGVRVTNYVQSDVHVKGSGSKNDPWEFVDKYYVRLDYDDTRLNVATSSFVVPGDGAVVTTITVRSGSIFTGNSCGASYDTTTNRFMITNINSDITCTLYSYPTNFVITYNSNGGQDCNPNYKNVTPEHEIGQMCEPQRNGYDFLGWFDEAENGVQITSDVILDQDIELYAHWSQGDIIITYNSNGGQNCNPNHKAISPGEVVGDLCVPQREGYGFDGWWTAETGGTRINRYDILNESTTLFAHWNINNLVVTYNCNGGSGVAPSSVNVSHGSQANISSKPCGYKIITGTGNGTSATPTIYYQTGWSTSSNGTAASSITITSNTTLYATWAKLFTYSTNYEVIDDGTGNWRIKFLSTGSLSIKKNTTVDIFAVGGGGGGGGVNCNTNSTVGAGGGGGGYVNTVSNTSLTNSSSYQVTIGSGGSGGTGNNTGSTGGTSSFGNLCSASGGLGGGAPTNNATNGNTGGIGGNGGSGGGAGKAQAASYENGIGTGGSYGGAGLKGGCAGSICYDNQSSSAFPSGGTGIGTTTCEFTSGSTSSCNAGITAYAGGGGGGVGSGSNACGSGAGSGGTGGGGAGGNTCYHNGANGTVNTGGGGGGAAACRQSGDSAYVSSNSNANYSGGAGGSGIVIIRNHR